MAKIDIDLSDLLAPIRQMREEMQRLVETMRQLSQFQNQVGRASGGGNVTLQGANGLSVARDYAGRPLPNNVVSIGGGTFIPPTNINPAGIQPPALAAATYNPLAAARQGVNIVSAMAGQAAMQNPQAKREMDDLQKILKGHTDKSGQLIADFLKKSESDLGEVSKLLGEKKRELALAMANNAENIKELTDSADELSKKFNTLNSSVGMMTEAAKDFVKQTGGGDGGAGGGGGGWWSKYGGTVGRGAAGLAATAAFGFQMASAYSGFQATGYQQNLSALREIPQNIAAAESLRYQKYMAVAAPTTGEQFLEAYGNLLTPGKKTFTYLGVGNRQAVAAESKKIFQEELKASEAERKSATLGGIGSAIGTAALSIGAIAAGAGLGVTGVGAVAGIPLIAAGVGGVIKSGTDLFGRIMGAETGLAGQKEGGVFGMTGAGLIHENAAENARRQMARFGATQTVSEEANQRMLLDSEKQRIVARRLAMGIDENLAALRMQTAATTMAGGAAVTGFEAFKNLSPEKAEALAGRYAKLGYSIPEVGQIYNQYASVMGTTKGAGNLLGLTRAGVGSAEQMASNILGISAVSGKVGDMKQLENVFAKAFETGLKGAPSIQRFAQAAIEMSSALKLQSADNAASMLSSLTSAMAGKTGSPLMYLGEAKAGLSALAAATGSTSGLMGTMKVLSGASQGLGMGALGLVAGSNVVQVQEAASQLAGPVEDYTKLTGLARQLVGVQIRAGMSPEAAMKKVRETLQAQAGAQTAPLAAGYKQVTGKDFSAVQAEARALLKAGKSEDLRNLLAEFKGETAGITGLEGEGAAEALLLSGLPPSEFKKGKNILAQEKGKGAAKAAEDFATVNYKRVLNKAALEAQGAIGREDVSRKELLETAAGLGIQGSEEQKIQALREAAGVKEGEKLSFAKLSTAMSVLSDKEGSSSRISVVEAFGDVAVQQLAAAFGTKPSGGEMGTTAGVGAPVKPIETKSQSKVMRTIPAGMR